MSASSPAETGTVTWRVKPLFRSKACTNGTARAAVPVGERVDGLELRMTPPRSAPARERRCACVEGDRGHLIRTGYQFIAEADERRTDGSGTTTDPHRLGTKLTRCMPWLVDHQRIGASPGVWNGETCCAATILEATATSSGDDCDCCA